MTQRSPIVVVNGRQSQLPPGDEIDGAVTGNVTASSGLIGGGDLGTGSKRFDVALEDNASGLIFVGESLGNDGTALVKSEEAIASGNAGLEDSVLALSSGTEYVEYAEVALASGNAALTAAVNATELGNFIELVADSDFAKGDPVSINSVGRAQKLEVVSTTKDISVGAKTTLTTNGATYCTSAYDPVAGLGVAMYCDSNFAGSKAFATSLEVVGNSVVKGPNTVLVSSGTTALNAAAGYLKITYVDGDDRFCATWRDNKISQFGTARVILVSGDGTLYPGQHLRSTGVAMTRQDTFYDPATNYVGMVYDGGSAEQFVGFKAITSASDSARASGYWYQPGANTNPGISDDSTQKAHVHDYKVGSGLLMYRQANRSNYLSAAVTTFVRSNNETGPSSSGIGDIHISNSVQPGFIAGCWIPTIERCLYVFEDDAQAGDPGAAICAHISGDTTSGIHFGDITTWSTTNSGDIQAIDVVWDEFQQKAVMVYQGDPDDYIYCRTGVPSGSTTSGEYNMAFGEPYLLVSQSSHGDGLELYYDSKAERCVLTMYNSSADDVEAYVLTPEVENTYSVENSLSQNNIVGLAGATVSSGDTLSVSLPQSTVAGLTGLDTGKFYYVDAISGTLTTSKLQGQKAPSWSGSINSETWRPVAKALSPTTLFVLDNL